MIKIPRKAKKLTENNENKVAFYKSFNYRSNVAFRIDMKKYL